MKNINWEDMKMVYQVALCGSLSKAADNLHINYSTVIRHIDRVEKALSCKLFIRHQRGYQKTDACDILLKEMPAIESAFVQLQQKLLPDQDTVSGTLRITTLPEYASILHPVLQRCIEYFPELKILVDVNDDVDFIDIGQAHVSIRAGYAPESADLIANPICALSYSYYASDDYIKRKGSPANAAQYQRHNWVMTSGRKRNISFIKNVLKQLDEKWISYQSNDFHDIQSAVCHGLGIGPVDDSKAIAFPNLQKIAHIKDVNDNTLWLVYHKDLKEDRKVKALLQLLGDTTK